MFFEEHGCFDVHASDYFGTGRMPPQELGAVLVKSQWQVTTPPCERAGFPENS